MHRKSNRPRPTLNTAREWLKVGSFYFSPQEHLLSEAEHDAEIKAVCNELSDMARQFPKTQNLEYAILKGHLIIEHVITQYIRCRSRVVASVEDVRFTFSQKLNIAYLMGFGSDDPTLLPSIDLFNKARNQVAHSFILDRKIVDELIRFNGGSDEPQSVSDRQRVRALRSICQFICGFVAGQIEAEHSLSKLIRHSK